MVRKFSSRRDTLTEQRRLLLQQQEMRVETLEEEMKGLVEAAWMAGMIYFRGKAYKPDDFGSSFSTAAVRTAERILSILFEHFDPITPQPAEVEQLLLAELTGPSTKFLRDELGILELDAGKYQPTCAGVIPTRIREYIESADGASGASLLATFADRPHAYQVEVIKACILGLLRGSKLKVQDPDGNEITAVRDAGVRDVFDKLATFRRSQFVPVGDDDIGVKARARICRFFEEQLDTPLDREDNAIADAVEKQFHALAGRLREVFQRLDRVPGQRESPRELTRLNDALEECLKKVRQTKPTEQRVKRKLEALIDGVKMLKRLSAELTDEALDRLRNADNVLKHEADQLREVEALARSARQATDRIQTQLASPRPWVDTVALEPEIERLREAYRAERTRLLEWQEQQAEQGRGRLRRQRLEAGGRRWAHRRLPAEFSSGPQ